MPTANPRVNVTLPPSLDDLVSRLARVEGASKSQVLRELLEAAEPALRRAVALMEAAEGATEAVRKGLAQSLFEHQLGVEAALDVAIRQAEIQDLADQAQRATLKRARAGAEPSPAPAPAVSTPVPVTRGSGRGGKARKGVRRARV
jgi:hypothetical protein